jgi:hypothetical protein
MTRAPMTRTSLRTLRSAGCLASLLLLLALPSVAQLSPSADAYTNTASPSTNYGAQKLLEVDSPSMATYIQFDLSSIPAGYTSSNIAKATLKLYVNTVPTAGSFNVDYVNGSWSESTIAANLSPALGTTIAASVPLTKSEVHDYILVDVTAAVGAWLNGTQSNDGIALVGNSPFNATFDSKENTTNSHPPELDIVFAGGGGSGITGINTSATSGLQGGGSSGTLNLSLITSCASGQILQWNGSAWKCASAGTGTITGVTAGADMTGGGTSGTVTLNLDTTKVPQLAMANTFTGNQTVNGNLSATGAVTSNSYLIGSDLFAFGSTSTANVFLGFSGNLSTSGTSNTAIGRVALNHNVDGYYNTATGTAALYSNTSGYNNIATGNDALTGNTLGYYNSATGAYALTNNTTGSQNTAEGRASLYFNTTGTSNTGLGFNAGHTFDLSNITGSNDTFVGANAVPSTGTLTNATAVGANAEVTESNALVLGSINGVNTATADTSVGIGTTAPASTLDVEANMAARSAPILLLKNNAAIQSAATGNAIDLRFAPDGGSSVGDPNAYIRVQEDGNSQYGAFMSFATMADGGAGAGAIERIRITANGSVGVGVSSPTHIFQVGQGLGAAFADGWSTYSSRRWKTNIQTLPNALAKVEQLRGVSYDLKGNGKHEIGVIAEEVGQVVPEVVSYEENGKDAQGVDYSRLTALLIEAVKQQQQQIRDQQEQVREQRAQIQSELKQVKAQQRQIIRLSSKVGVLEANAQETRQSTAARSVTDSRSDRTNDNPSKTSLQASR